MQVFIHVFGRIARESFRVVQNAFELRILALFQLFVSFQLLHSLVVVGQVLGKIRHFSRNDLVA